MFDKKPVDFYPFDRKEAGVFGYELEIEGNHLPLAIDGWLMHEEGSLRGGPGRGHEYVTAGSMSDLQLQRRLANLEAALTAPGVIVRPSHRCSVHVHYNIRERTFWDIVGSVITFTAFEPLLLRMCGPDRDGNLFCMSSADSGELQNWFEGFVAALHRGDPGGVQNRGKYASLNLDHIWTLGTLEVRCFPPTISAEEGLRYARTVRRIFELGTGVEGHSGYVNYVEAILASPEVFIEEVFPDWPLPPDAIPLVEFGCQGAYELARTLAVEMEQEVKKPESKRVTLGWGLEAPQRARRPRAADLARMAEGLR